MKVAEKSDYYCQVCGKRETLIDTTGGIECGGVFYPDRDINTGKIEKISICLNGACPKYYGKRGYYNGGKAPMI